MKNKDEEMGLQAFSADEEQHTNIDDKKKGGDTINSQTQEDGKRRPPEEIVPYLASRSFHLPGNGWCQDWFQYVIANNHAFFSLLCAHKDHPVTDLERVLMFLASLAASIVISNGFYIFFLVKDDGHLKSARLLQAVFNGNNSSNSDDDDDGEDYKNYEFAVMTVGALLHSLFKYVVWKLAACGCCEAGGCLHRRCHKLTWSGTAALGLIVFTTSVLAIVLFLLQETIENGREGIDKHVDANYTKEILNKGLVKGIDLGVALLGTNAEDSGYSIERWSIWWKELCISLFCYDLIVSTVYFTGILGFLHFIPFIGPNLAGRPLEMKELREKGKDDQKKARKKR